MKKNFITADNIINQDILRQVEALCTQQQPPACMAACPLHLNARALCASVAEENIAGAFQLYQKAVPFARLVAYTCDAPCEGKCKRAQLGGAIQMRRLEQHITQAAGKPMKPPLMLPKKSKKAAIAGGGLRGMAAAYELARKGYQVALFEKTDRLGGLLRALPEAVLPQTLLEEEIAALLAFPIQVQYGVEVPLHTAEAAAAFLLDGFDVAFAACSSPLGALADGGSLLVSGQSALLAGQREGRMTQGHSSIYDVYDGRSAAYSMDRLLQGVNVMSGREKEGSAETALYTNLEGIEAAAPIAPCESGFDAAGAKAEAERCIRCQCLECVKKCGFLRHYGADPSRYVREVYNNLSIAMGNHLANGMINTCALCGQCEAVCPNGLDMRQVFLAARQRMVLSQKMPPSAYEFALEDMEYSLSDAFYLLRHQPGYKSSAYLFFPGCQLAASEPGLAEAAYRDLCARLEGGVGLWLACCGIMAHWAGHEARFKEIGKRFAAEWEGMGRPPVIAACPTCVQVLREQFEIEAVSLYETLANIGLPEAERPAQSLVLHHACGARHDAAVRRRVHRVAALCGAAVGQADEDVQTQSPCCGYGGLTPFVSEEVAGGITQVALEQLPDSAPVLTYCVNCRDRYFAKGRSAVYILELVYPDTALNQKAPTWSRRQDNRAALKRGLLQTLWKKFVEEEQKMRLYIDDTLEQKLQSIHILHSDVAAAIRRAEAEEEKLLDPETGRCITSHRPRNVTFWVEYSPHDGGCRVHNAWCHRMHAIVTDKLTESGAQGHE